MLKTQDKTTVFFDVDDTLVVWGNWDEYTPNVIRVPDQFGDVMLVPHSAHISALISEKKKGSVVVVWSQGGSDWAESVVNVLGLQNYVDLVMRKGEKYYDDLHVTDFMTERVYLPQG